MMKGDNMTDDGNLSLSSTHSIQVSLQTIRAKKAGLDAKRKGLLDKVPNTGDWITLDREAIQMMDLAYLTASTGDEFAILRGRHKDVLFHGDKNRCQFGKDPCLKDALLTHKYELYGHSHPGEPFPIPSDDDRWILRKLGQKTSKLISGMTGICIEFGCDG